MINSIQLFILVQPYYNMNLKVKVSLALKQKHTNPEKETGCTSYLKYNENKLLFLRTQVIQFGGGGGEQHIFRVANGNLRVDK